MLEDLHRDDRVEALAGSGELLRRRRPIVDIELDLGGVAARGFDGLDGGVGGDEVGAEAAQRLAEQPGAAADIEHAQARQRPRRQRLAIEVTAAMVADVGEACRVEAMQGAHRPARIPPARGQRVEARDLRGVDAG